MNADFARRLRGGQALIGTIVTLSCPRAAEVLARTGFDWLFLDGEHAPLEPSRLQAIMQAAGGVCPCVVRIPENREAHVKQALDGGAEGVIVPRVNDGDAARRAVQYAKYPPVGGRSVGIARAQAYGRQLDDYVATANDRTALIVQVEHARGVANIDAILAVEGVDAVFIGPYDLSASLGKPGDLADAEVRRCIDLVRDRCLAHGKPLGIFTMDPAAVASLKNQGFTLIALGMDTVMLGRAAGDMLARAR